MKYILLFAVLAGVVLPAPGQPSVVAPGAGFHLEVDGRPFFPRGWYGPGTCTDAATELTHAYRDSVRAHLAVMRRHGTNTILEPAAANGRVVARAVTRGAYNWYGYTFEDAEGRRQKTGHPYPGAYVEGLRWLMDQGVQAAPGGPEQPIYTLVALAAFVTPGYEGTRYDGSEVLDCRTYQAFIEAERARHARVDPERARRIPAVSCPRPGERRPFWEWNLRYVVHGVRDHPGLLGWYLWDEPEGISYRHLFGTVEGRPRRYTGPASLPTPDLLRYAYGLVQAFELEGRPGGYQRHPVVVDLHSPHVFFSDRFAWSTTPDPRWSSGPFDRTPDGGYHTPADVLGQEASSYLVNTQGRGNTPRMEWYWDPNFVSRTADMLAEVVRRDDLWAAITVAAQAQLPDAGPYAADAPLRCTPSGQWRTRLLNDRDLVWNLLTPLTNGLRGYVYYAHYLLPAEGAGAEQGRRSHRLLRQFEAAGLDRVFTAPRRTTGWAVASVRVDALTNYYRSDPSFVGPAERYDPGRSAFTLRRTIAPEAYTVARFGRSSDPRHYGHATPDPYTSVHPGHALLRTAYHRYGGRDYVFLSNAYDARVVASLRIGALERRPELREGRFDLGPGGSFSWQAPAQAPRYDAAGQQATFEVALEPYEARFFEITYP